MLLIMRRSAALNLRVHQLTSPSPDCLWKDPVCLFPLLHYFVCTTVIILLAQICVGVLAALQQSYMGTELRLNIY